MSQETSPKSGSLPPVHSGSPLALRLYAVGVVQLVVLLFAVIFVGYLLHSARDRAEAARASQGASSGPGWQNHQAGSPQPGAGGPCEPPEAEHPGPPPQGPAAGRGGEGGPELHSAQFNRHREHHGPPLSGPILTFMLSGLLIVGLGSWASARWLIRPLAQLTGAAEQLGQGDLSARVAVKGPLEFQRLGQSFNDMAERLELLVRAEKELLANVSHELRTPLARIRVLVDLAAESEPEFVVEHLKEISADLAELETLTRDILTFGGQCSGERRLLGGFVLRKEEVDLSELLRDSCQRLETLAPGRPTELQVEAELPRVQVDPALFRRVVDNVLINAHKYTPDETQPITVRADSQGGLVRITIRDRGIGVRKEEQELVFQPFFRAERSRVRSQGGVGLGLALARRIIGAHQGQIRLVEIEGPGSMIEIRFPAESGSSGEARLS